jgi:hypothetical protein
MTLHASSSLRHVAMDMNAAVKGISWKESSIQFQDMTATADPRRNPWFFAPRPLERPRYVFQV